VEECAPLVVGDGAAADARQGEVVQLEPMKSNLKAPGTKRLKLKYHILLSTVAFNFNMRRYVKYVLALLTVGYIVVEPEA
jgi:hypothetical protein